MSLAVQYLKGDLYIRVVGAKLTIDTETFGKMDPYAVVTAGSAKFKTKTHENGGTTPSWKDEFKISMDGGLAAFDIFVYDKEDLGSDVFLGNLTVPLVAPPPHSNAQWAPIKSKGGKEVGQVGVALAFVGYAPDGTYIQQSFGGSVAPSAQGPGGAAAGGAAASGAKKGGSGKAGGGKKGGGKRKDSDSGVGTAIAVAVIAGAALALAASDSPKKKHGHGRRHHHHGGKHGGSHHGPESESDEDAEYDEDEDEDEDVEYEEDEEESD